MRIRVGNIGGRCETCGCEDFQPVPPAVAPANELACFSCGALMNRRALLTQIAEETVRRAERLLRRARRQ
jgi:hypothetical protein